MLTNPLVVFVLFNICFQTFLVNTYEKNENFDEKKTQREIKKLEDIEKKLDKLRGLLKDPEDEEHDDLSGESDETHAHEWTLQLDTDNLDDALAIAKKYGFHHVHKLDVGYGVYRFTHSKKIADKKVHKENKDVEDVEKTISKRDHIEAAKFLANDEKVRWYKRSRILSREKRVPINDAYKEFEEVQKRSKRSTTQNVNFNDPSFKYEWYIKNDGQTTGPKGFDSNIVPVWERGITGKNVVLSVLDDGMDHTHPELIDNYDPEASTDLNDHDDDPFPNDSDPYNAHGTKCSGTIAAKNNNSLCGVGIAYDSRVGAIRMLDGKATDGLEANALSFRRDHIDIFSCSWGPKDDGRTFGRPGRLGNIALAQGAKFGRNGKGSLFIWATGNGGMAHDDCNADGYVNSIYTLGIGSANEHGVSTYYGERCSAMFAVTYCSGKHQAGLGVPDPKANVITTYLHHQCTNHFVGTSSAAPLAAGIFALVLEANNEITWRDLQHLVFQTATKTSPMDLDWRTNGVGKPYNHKFGFGVLDAEKLVLAALNWTHVAKQRTCHFKLNFKNGNIPSRHTFKLSFKTNGCQECKKKQADGKCKNAVTHLEHVVVNVTLKHRRRGDLTITLISPSGTVSNLLHARPYDGSSSGLKGWTFMTVYNWGENPNGTWKLIFEDLETKEDGFNKVTRDVEEEYIEKLDREKEQDEKARRRQAQESGEQQSTSSDERSVNAEEGIYKRAYKEDDGNRYNSYNSYRREESAYDNLRREYESRKHRYDDVPSDYSSERYKRSVDEHEDEYADDKTDYVKYKKSEIKNFKYEYDDDALKKSILAGEVLDISVTFYGTA